MTKIGFLGPKGTFSQEAMLAYTKERSLYSGIDFNSMADIIYAVQDDTIDEAIVPIENSLEGAINLTMDMIANDVDLMIKSEIVIAVNQNLLVKEGTKPENIKYILSHPQPIGQCRKYINTHFPGAEIKLVYSTTTAAQEVAAGNGDLAAVASHAAAKVYGLHIYGENIQDNNNNFTRFVVLAKKDCERTGADKTSIVFSTEDKPGSLYGILDIFNLWDINMTRIESRPAKNQLGRYIFFVDVKGHRDDDDIRDALTMVRRKTSFYKFLGSYPEFTFI